MAFGSKSPSQSGSKRPKHYTKTVSRWAKRKATEKADGIDRAISDIAIAGSRRDLWWQRCHLERVKADLRKAERVKLATTSLGDLIK